MKVKLLKQLSTGFKTPPQAKAFISLMMDEYSHLCRVASKMSGLLKDLVCSLSLFIIKLYYKTLELISQNVN